MDISLEELLTRPERLEDYEQISDLLDFAFKQHDEAELVDRIRLAPEYINDLTLVALREHQIVGFIMLSYVTLKNDCDSFKVLALGPVAVLPNVQSSGIGGLLIREAISLAEKCDEPLIVLLGHASYYPRFGFKRASLYNIFPPLPWNDENFMVQPLANFQPAMNGKIHYPAPWQIT